MNTQDHDQHIDDREDHKPRAHVICRLARGRYAIDAHRVRRITLLGRVWRLPGAPDFVLGVTELRGTLVPVIDLRRRLGLAAAPPTDRTCVIEMDDAYPWAVAVDAVDRVSPIALGDIIPIPWASEATGEGVIAGVVYTPKRPCLVLRPERFLMGRAAEAGERTTPEHSMVTSKVPQRDIPTTWRRAEAEESNGHSAPTEPDPARAQHPRPPVTASIGNERSAAENPPTTTAEDWPDHTSWSVVGVVHRSQSEQIRHLCERLATPVYVNDRRVPGFRSGDARLTALASGLLLAPPVFTTAEAAPLVAGELGTTARPYGLTHFRYDLRKLRVRHLAERLGVSRRYELTRIGRLVCKVLGRRKAAAVTSVPRIGELVAGHRAAMSA